MDSSRTIYSICLLSLVVLCCYSVKAKAKASCSIQLGSANVPSRPKVPLKGQEPKTCVSNTSCCTRHMEEVLKQKAVKDLKHKVHRRLDGLKHMMNILREELKVHFQAVIKNAKRKNVDSLQRLNANISTIGIPLVTSMFNHVEDYIDNPKVNLTTVVLQFFRDAFPPLFNYATGQSRQFSHPYEECLKKKVNTVQLFGSSPFRIAAELEKVLKPMQVFLQSLTFAEKTADDTKALDFTKGCPPLLLQMKYCALCKGEDNIVKPCENYCIDVLKSCLTTSIQLQSQWSLYFDALKDLATSLSMSSDLNNVLNTVFNELSLAIYQAVPVHMADANLRNNLFKACGQPRFGSSSIINGGVKQTPSKVQRQSSLEEVMNNVKSELNTFKISYEQLPLDVCVKEQIAAPRTEQVISGNCWNGTALGRYSGPVSSPLPSLEALPLDTIRINNLVANLKTNILMIKEYTVEYDGSSEGSVYSGDSNAIPGSADCDDEDDESCYSGESGDRKNQVDSEDSNGQDTNTDIYVATSTSNPNEDAENELDGGQSNVKGFGSNSGTSLVVSSTINLVLLSTIFLPFLTLIHGIA